MKVTKDNSDKGKDKTREIKDSPIQTHRFFNDLDEMGQRRILVGETASARDDHEQNTTWNHSVISNSELCLIGFFADTATYKLCSIDERSALLDNTHRGAEAGTNAIPDAPGKKNYLITRHLLWSNTMNAKKLIAAVAMFAAAGSVFAADLMPFPEMDNFQSTRTRADVRAETLRDRDQTAYAQSDIGAFEQPAATSTRSRLAVHKEAIESVRNHRSTGFDYTGS